MTEAALAHVAQRVTDPQFLLLLVHPDHESTPRFKKSSGRLHPSALFAFVFFSRMFAHLFKIFEFSIFFHDFPLSMFSLCVQRVCVAISVGVNVFLTCWFG